MFGAFQTFGKFGAIGKAISAAWSPLALWPNGASSPGMWIDPSLLTASFNDYAGTTPVATPGTVADSANPVGLALDIRAGATAVTDPGNHMLQATSAARPLESARVNLITRSEDFTVDANWGANATTLSAGFVEGGVTFSKFIETATDLTHDRYARIGLLANVHYIYSAKFKAAERTIATIWTWDANYQSDAANVTYFNLSTQEIQLASNGITTGGMIDEGGGIYRCWVGITPDHNTAAGSPTYGMATGMGVHTYLGDGTSGLYVGGAQVEAASSLGVYQAIAASGIYPSTGFPVYQHFDGTDDGMATATFAAGTLIDGMDCMIAVRRDSAAATYLISNTGSRGFFEWESGDTNRPDVSAGTPTYYVDGVAVTATRGALFTALTAGDWHILEARGLDLSTWTALEVSCLVSYRLNGARGDIFLYPSTTPTEDKDAARQYLADKYGVTLP